MSFTVCVAFACWFVLFVFNDVILCDMCLCVYVACLFVCCIVVVILPQKTTCSFKYIWIYWQLKVLLESHTMLSSMDAVSGKKPVLCTQIKMLITALPVSYGGPNREYPRILRNSLPPIATTYGRQLRWTSVIVTTVAVTAVNMRATVFWNVTPYNCDTMRLEEAGPLITANIWHTTPV
jgi:hypothetical protein